MTARAQNVLDSRNAIADRAPRFLFAQSLSSSTFVPVDVNRTPVLRRRIAVNFDGTMLEMALRTIGREAGLKLAYSKHVVGLERPVYLKAADITVAAALTEVLLGAGVDIVLSPGNQAALVKRASAQQLGTIRGTVTDASTHAPLVGVTVRVVETELATVSDDRGEYRIAKVPPGAYTVSARRIGYQRAVQPVTVDGDGVVTINFALEKSASQLDQIVVTGTVVPTAVKALPTPITVITQADIEAGHPRTFNQLFRQAVPSAVAWDNPSGANWSLMSVRGSNSLVPASNSMKIYIDGIETAYHGLSAIDPAMIGRVEVIRGPEAGAIYGSDALGGVVQIFTKRGDSAMTRPHVDATAAVGFVQSGYSSGATARESYAASVRGGRPDMSYALGGSYTHLGDWLPSKSSQSNPSVYGNLSVDQGPVTVNLTGRYGEQHNWDVLNPDLRSTGYAAIQRNRYYLPNTDQTIGAHLEYAPSSWWHHAVTVGFDREASDEYSVGPNLATPDDTLDLVANSGNARVSVAYNTSVTGKLGPNVDGSIVAGLDHYTFRTEFFYTTGALNTSGTLQLAPGQSILGSRAVVTNTGYFIQGQLGYRSALFLTAGLRAEQNSEFGRDAGVPLSPRVGVAYSTDVGQTTVKLRGSYGEATRPPSPGAKQAAPGAFVSRIANPDLGPERQKGWDSGIDVTFGQRGSLSATYYDQAATGLITVSTLSAGPPQVTQTQNIGRVRNSGLEFNGAFNIDMISLQGQFAVTNSRVENLGSSYTGDLRVGDRTFLVPKYTGGAKVVVSPLPRTTVTGGVAYVSSWTYYDYQALYSCFGGVGPCQPGPGLRGYLAPYSGFTKWDVGLTQKLTRSIDAFISVDNLANNTTQEYTNIVPTIGRTTTIGFKFEY